MRESVDVCRAGLALHPSYLSARVTLGRALVELNEIDQAAVELAIVLKNAPENLAAMRAMGEIHLRRGNDAEALAQFRAALAIARNDPDLEQTVDDLARKIEPKVPVSSSDALSQSEFLQQLPAAPVAVVAVVAVAAAPVAAAAPDDEAASNDEVGPVAHAAPDPAPAIDLQRDRAERTVVALEGWLEAIHVARADKRA